MTYADAKNLKDPERHPPQTSFHFPLLSGLLECLFDALHVAIAFINTDESSVPSVYREERDGFHPEKWSEKIIAIPARNDAGVLVQLENLAKTPDLVDRAVCGHDDLQVAQFFNPGCDGTGLQLTMFAVRIEEHEHHRLSSLEIPLRELC